jgi:hypothetical protein
MKMDDVSSKRSSKKKSKHPWPFRSAKKQIREYPMKNLQAIYHPPIPGWKLIPISVSSGAETSSRTTSLASC